jgi:uncharacterized membrane protein
MDDRADSDVLLDAVLRPSPPLSPDILRLILGIVGLLNLAFATFFVLRGAWPIAPFMGADIALLAWAFRSVRNAAKREEHVTLTPSTLRVTAKPGPYDVSLNPYWVRVDMADPPEHNSQLTLWSHGKGVRIGTFLAPTERAAFAKRLKSALYLAKSRIG